MTRPGEAHMNPPAGGLDDPGVQAVAMRALELIADGARVGLGSGRAASLFITNLGLRRQDGLQVSGVPTSHASAYTARRAGIPLIELGEDIQLDITIDGAHDVELYVFAQLDKRSEEHTSELQSRLHLVCRLLLEKKKHHTNILFTYHHPRNTISNEHFLNLFTTTQQSASTPRKNQGLTPLRISSLLQLRAHVLVS